MKLTILTLIVLAVALHAEDNPPPPPEPTVAELKSENEKLSKLLIFYRQQAMACIEQNVMSQPRPQAPKQESK